MDVARLFDELCDKLDESGIEGNVIERDFYGRPYVNIWYGKFEDPPRERPEGFTVIITDYSLFISLNGCYEIKPPEKYRDYFKDTFMDCSSMKSGFYVMSSDKIVRTIKFLFNREKMEKKMEKKKENNMSNIKKEATKELCHIIAYEADRSPLRWTNAGDDYSIRYNCDSIYICDSRYYTDNKVCKVRIYEQSLKHSINKVYYVYFTDKYSSVAKDIKDPRIIGITNGDGYKFMSPKHVVDFVREVVKCKERGGVLKDCTTKEEPIMMKWEVRTPDLPTIRAVDVIFNDPATIIIWADGSKTVVKAENEPFDPEKGLAMAISKKVLGNKYDYYDVFKKYVGRYEKKQKKGKK